MRKCFDLLIKFFQLTLKGNVWKSVWRIGRCILGVRRLGVVFLGPKETNLHVFPTPVMRTPLSWGDLALSIPLMPIFKDWAVRVISLKFLLVITKLHKTGWSWDLKAWSQKMNLIDTSTNSPYLLYWKPKGKKWEFDSNTRVMIWGLGWLICTGGGLWL